MSGSGGVATGKTPNFKFLPSTFDSLDARIIQYKYAITKLEAVIKTIDAKLVEAKSPKGSNGLILIQYIVYLTSTVFAINESGFGPKLNALETFKAIKPSTVAISQIVTHVAYDFKDQPVTPLESLPSVKASINCLNSLKHFCTICLDGYKKRQINAANEIKNDPYMEDLEYLFKSSFFNLETDIDLSLSCLKLPGPHFVLPGVQEIDLEDVDHIEACLIDMDIRSLFELTLLIPLSLNRHKQLIAKYREIKLLPKQQQQVDFEKIINYNYSLHRILFWALRLNDLYAIIRRFGRKIYLSNYEHLTDQKFLSYVPNLSYFRLKMLPEIDEYFNTAKKNGVLIATTTRFIRMNSKHTIDANTALEFVTFIQQSFTYVESMIEKLHAFGISWLTGELSFRKLHDLPQNNLLDIVDAIQKESARKALMKKEKELALQRERAKEKAKERAREEAKQKAREMARDKARENEARAREQSAEAEQAKEIERANLPAKKPSTKASLDIPRSNQSKTKVIGDYQRTRDSRSSSVSSIEITLDPNNPRKVTQPGNRSRSSSLNANPSPERKTLSRPLSMIFLGNNGSASSLQQPSSSPIDKNQIVNTTSEGRRRSCSQPLSVSAAAKSLNALLSTNSSRLNLLRSPPAALGRSNTLPKKSPNTTPQASPKALKPIIMEVLEEASGSNKEKKLTANQKFQMHLREASKAGALYAQQKEVLSNVVFDPNNPSSTKIRRQVDPAKQKIPIEEPEGKAEAPVKVLESKTSQSPTANTSLIPTRSQVTRLNTKRNSVILKVEDIVSDDASQDSPDGSQIRSISEEAETKEVIVKKVRFIGVPAYSTAEDAPSSQSSRILRNFAIPSIVLRQSAGTAFKKKDQQLKSEESYLFRQQLRPNTELNSPPITASYVPSLQTLKLSRFKSRF